MLSMTVCIISLRAIQALLRLPPTTTTVLIPSSLLDPHAFNSHYFTCQVGCLSLNNNNNNKIITTQLLHVYIYIHIHIPVIILCCTSPASEGKKDAEGLGTSHSPPPHSAGSRRQGVRPKAQEGVPGRRCLASGTPYGRL